MLLRNVLLKRNCEHVRLSNLHKNLCVLKVVVLICQPLKELNTKIKVQLYLNLIYNITYITFLHSYQ